MFEGENTEIPIDKGNSSETIHKYGVFLKTFLSKNLAFNRCLGAHCMLVMISRLIVTKKSKDSTWTPRALRGHRGALPAQEGGRRGRGGFAGERAVVQPGEPLHRRAAR